MMKIVFVMGGKPNVGVPGWIGYELEHLTTIGSPETPDYAEFMDKLEAQIQSLQNLALFFRQPVIAELLEGLEDPRRNIITFVYEVNSRGVPEHSTSDLSELPAGSAVFLPASLKSTLVPFIPKGCHVYVTHWKGYGSDELVRIAEPYTI